MARRPVTPRASVMERRLVKPRRLVKSRRPWLVAIVMSAAALVGVGVPAASATLGAGVGASPLELAKPAHGGTVHELVPALLVVNTGTQAANYRLRVDRLSAGPGRTVPPGWIHFDANNFHLAPDSRRSVVVRLSVPGSAATGAYQSDVVATAVLPVVKGQTAAGAAAATVVSFSVTNGSGSSFPWAIAVVVAAWAALVGLYLLIRRSGFRLKVERRRSSP
jgi:hypothetical protein